MIYYEKPSTTYIMVKSPYDHVERVVGLRLDNLGLKLNLIEYQMNKIMEIINLGGRT